MAQAPDLLAAAAGHHRAGRLQEAAQGYLAVLQRQPDHPDALQLLGMVAHRLGRTAQGLELVNRALQVDPRHEIAHANRATLLHALDRLPEAEKAARQALKLRPGHPGVARTLARVRRDRGELTDATRILRTARAEHPEDAGLLEELCAVLLARAAWPEATPVLGERAHRSSQPAHWTAFVDALSQHPEPGAELAPFLEAAYGQKHLDLQRLERATRASLAASHGFAEALDDPESADLAAVARTLGGSRLAMLWLRRTVVASGPWERLLTALRDHLLGNTEPPHLVLLGALATQAWHTEYAWRTPEDDVLPDTVDDRAQLAAAPLAPLPHTAPPSSGALRTLFADTVGPALAARRIGSALDSLGLSDDATSQAVAAQYESHPYPRLVHVQQRPAAPLEDLVRNALPGIDLPDFPRPLQVLVAGCGTGQHPISTATRLSECEVLALDLSRASLGRAAAEAARRGVSNLRFLHADILALEALHESDGPFHLIESGGVLHHLADPMAGWRSLLAHLAPGGLLRIGLYSERGRADVIAARALATEHGWTGEPDSIRAARQHILSLPGDHPAAGLRHSHDFYSLSGARDLFLHVQEHRFTPLELAQSLDALDLEFLGFLHGQRSVVDRYQARFPDDPSMTSLANWDALEADHPRIFSGMFQFWCRRR